jgi:hypothetical protein
VSADKSRKHAMNQTLSHGFRQLNEGDTVSLNDLSSLVKFL